MVPCGGWARCTCRFRSRRRSRMRRSRRSGTWSTSRGRWSIADCSHTTANAQPPNGGNRELGIGQLAIRNREWQMAIRTYGTMAVDWEQRIDFDRLRRERLARIKERLAKSELG